MLSLGYYDGINAEDSVREIIRFDVLVHADCGPWFSHVCHLSSVCLFAIYSLLLCGVRTNNRTTEACECSIPAR